MIPEYQSLFNSVCQQSPLLAMALRDHQNIRGAPMAFGTMPYLPALYHEFPTLEGADIISAVQTGKSELFLLLMLYLSGWQGRICAYVLPTYSIRNRFVSRRIDPLMIRVPAYRDRIPGGAPGLAPEIQHKGSLAAKFFGPGAMLFLSSGTPTDFVEFTADALFIDELDRCDPGNVALARDRILASPTPQLFRLGNPEIPGQGIDRAWSKSDRRRWYYRCPACGERQPLDWFVNFVRRLDDGGWAARDQERAPGPLRTRAAREGRPDGETALSPVRDDIRPVCRRCDRPFERAASWEAWIAENPGQAVRRGYHMSRLDVLHQSIGELAGQWVEAQGSTDDVSRFYGSILGVAYQPTGSQVTVEELRACTTGPDNDHLGGASYADDVVVMGVDVGSVLNVVVDRLVARPDPESGTTRISRQAAHVGGYLNFSDLDDLVRRFNIQCVVIDEAPERRKTAELRDRLIEAGVEVWLCRYYPTPRTGRQRFGLTVDYQTRVVSVDRTQLLDAAHDDIREKSRVFPSDMFSTLGWSDQMQAPKRVLNVERARIVWDEAGKPDHYRHADAYALCASEMLQLGGVYGSG